MKIVFFGTPQFAVSSLKTLANTKGITIEAVVTQPDKKIGRKQMLTAPPVKQEAKELGLKVLQPNSKKELESALKDVKADFFVVIAYGMMLQANILNIPKHGSINVHASLLPKYRGASPIQESLLHGDAETGISIMKMDKELDHGDIYLIKRVKITESDTEETLSAKLSKTSSLILPLALEDIINGTLSPIPQNHKIATFCKKIEKENGKIDLENKTAEEIKNMVRAYTPWPSAYIILQGKSLKILETKTSEENLAPGKFSVENNTLKIGTKKGCLIPTKVQPEGKNPMEITAFLNGYRPLIEPISILQSEKNTIVSQRPHGNSHFNG